MVDEVTQKIIVGVVSAVALAALVIAYRKMLLPTVAFLRCLPTVVVDVAFIKSELNTNGGLSLKDRVNDISDSVTLLEARQRGLIAALPRATFETDDQFNWIEGNHALERLTGHGFAHLARKRWVTIIHEDDRASVMEEIAHAVKDRRGLSLNFHISTETVDMDVHMEAKPTFSKGASDLVLCWTGWIAKSDDRRVDERRMA